jgi:hypothetical protein
LKPRVGFHAMLLPWTSPNMPKRQIMGIDQLQMYIESFLAATGRGEIVMFGPEWAPP